MAAFGCAFRDSIGASVTRTGASRWVATVASASARSRRPLMSSKRMMPALLTSTLSPGCSATTCRAKAVMASRLSTSRRMACMPGRPAMEELKQVVRRYAAAQADHDGVVLVPAVPGLRMVCVEAPRGLTHTFYRPLVCLVLQGAKRLQAGADQRVFAAGQTMIVGADLPVASRIV